MSVNQGNQDPVDPSRLIASLARDQVALLVRRIRPTTARQGILRGSSLSSAFAMRVCQPVPVAFQRARTLLVIRGEIAVLGSPTTGRPRLRATVSPIW